MRSTQNLRWSLYDDELETWRFDLLLDLDAEAQLMYITLDLDLYLSSSSRFEPFFNLPSFRPGIGILSLSRDGGGRRRPWLSSKSFQFPVITSRLNRSRP